MRFLSSSPVQGLPRCTSETRASRRPGDVSGARHSERNSSPAFTPLSGNERSVTTATSVTANHNTDAAVEVRCAVIPSGVSALRGISLSLMSSDPSGVSQNTRELCSTWTLSEKHESTSSIGIPCASSSEIDCGSTWKPAHEWVSRATRQATMEQSLVRTEDLVPLRIAEVLHDGAARLVLAELQHHVVAHAPTELGLAQAPQQHEAASQGSGRINSSTHWH